MNVERHDVIVAGAGPAGCATALALADAGARVLLLDRPLAQPFRIGESATPEVASLLGRLGAGRALEGHAPYHGNVSLWGDATPRLDHFLFRAHGQGWHLDRTTFDSLLWNMAAERGVTVRRPAVVDGLHPHRDGWSVGVRDLGAVVARVLVDAGGRRSPLATRLGAQRRRLDRLQALACHARPGAALAGYALVESCPLGWWYAAGLPDGRALVALMTDQDIARVHRLHEAQAYLAAWRQTRLLAERVPPQDRVEVCGFAAHSGCISHAAGPGWLCVGDALIGMDPLTSSGIGCALSDALVAAPAIIGMLDGRYDAARAYVQRADQSFRRYLGERARHYAREGRWGAWPFWQRRQGEARERMAA